MATVFTQDAVLHFLQSKGGSVKNSDLLLHFRNFIRNHAEQDRNRELFKKFVNSVATVRQQDSVSYVVLRRKFRGHTPGDGDGDSGGGSSGPPRLSAAENSDPCPVVTVEKHSLKLQPRQVTTAAPPGETLSKTIIPAAGIMINNIVETNLNPKQTQQQVTRASDLSGRLAAVQVASQTPSLSKPLVQDEGPELAQQRVAFCLLPADKQHGASKQVSVPQTVRGREDGLQREAPPLHPEVAPCRFRYRQSYKSAVSYDEDVEEEDEVAIRPGRAEAWPQSASLVDTGRAISTSLPCIIDTPAPPSVVSSSSSSSSERSLPKIYIRNVEEEALPPCDPGLSFESGIGLKGQWMGMRLEPMSVLAESASTRHNQPLQTACYTSTAGKAKEVSPQRNIHQDHQYSHASGVQLEPRTELCQSQTSWLSPSHSSIVSPSSDASFSSSDWPPSGSSKGSGWNSSYGDLQARAGELYHDREEAESSEGSTSAPVPWQRPAFTRRLSSQLRNRMCRSLGADLDQLPQEARGRGGSEAARLNRLHLISSSLSLHCNLSSSSLSSCSTPPRCHSLADLVQEKGGKRSLHAVTSSTTHYEGPGRQSLVPLEPKEHSWLVKGAAGAWTDVYSLFREDSSLLNKQDFISGFTVLHWIAKHGDHRVLNTLWYGVQKAGLLFDINARSTCGYTPLHIAAIHGNKNIMRLLVNKFNADVRLRDTAGKKPWQYLSSNVPVDIFQLLGAPAWAAVGGVSRVEAGWEKQQQCRRRRPHHLSSASSGERPLTIAGTMRVKRSSSIAAFLKQKSLRRFHGYQSNPLV